MLNYGISLDVWAPSETQSWWQRQDEETMTSSHQEKEKSDMWSQKKYHSLYCQCCNLLLNQSQIRKMWSGIFELIKELLNRSPLHPTPNSRGRVYQLWLIPCPLLDNNWHFSKILMCDCFLHLPRVLLIEPLLLVTQQSTRFTGERLPLVQLADLYTMQSAQTRLSYLLLFRWNNWVPPYIWPCATTKLHLVNN